MAACYKIGNVLTVYINFTDHCSDKNIKKAYSLAMKQGLDQSKNFQLVLVGAENTGKTSLISSFLGEEFVEGRPATKGVVMEVCKVYSKDWLRISHSDKSNILHNLIADQCNDEMLKTMASSSISSSQPSSYNPSLTDRKSRFRHSNLLFTSVSLSESIMTPPASGTSEDSHKPYTQDAYVNGGSLQAAQYNADSLIASIWDFPGQVVFHNFHSVFRGEANMPA